MKKRREIATIVRDLRKRLELTQQAFATLLGSAISTTVRYEHGSKPSVQQLSKLLEVARANGFDDIAEELQLYFNVSLGPWAPVTTDPVERICVLLARRIYQNPKRRAKFLQWAEPELEMLIAENEMGTERNDSNDWFLAKLDKVIELSKKRESK